MSDPYPPSEELREAVQTLSGALADAGWMPAAKGLEWYEHRYSWPGEQDPPDHIDVEPPPSIARWTCEIEWKPGYLHSRFRAVASPPGGRRGKPIAESPQISWPAMSKPQPPSPELREVHRALTAAIAEAGWVPAGKVGPWYAHRFNWTAEHEPPDHIDVEPGRVTEERHA